MGASFCVINCANMYAFLAQRCISPAKMSRAPTCMSFHGLACQVYKLSKSTDELVSAKNKKRFESFLNKVEEELKENVLTETSVEEILKMNDKVDPEAIKKMANKKQNVIPIIDVIIHVIR